MNPATRLAEVALPDEAPEAVAPALWPLLRVNGSAATRSVALCGRWSRLQCIASQRQQTAALALVLTAGPVLALLDAPVVV